MRKEGIWVGSIDHILSFYPRITYLGHLFIFFYKQKSFGPLHHSSGLPAYLSFSPYSLLLPYPWAPGLRSQHIACHLDSLRNLSQS